MANQIRARATVPVVDRPEEYAVSIADDRHLAAQFCQYYSLGDTPDADALVTDEARAILARCAGATVADPGSPGQALDASMRSIDAVATRSQERGDAVQVAWCRMLRHALATAG